MPSSRSPRRVVLVPLPDVAVELGLRVDLVLVHVELLTEHLFDRRDHARMTTEQRERLVVGVRRERRARRTALLAPDLGTVRAEHLRRLLAQHADFLCREKIGQQQPAFVLELLHLRVGQSHLALLGLTIVRALGRAFIGAPPPGGAQSHLQHATCVRRPGVPPGSHRRRRSPRECPRARATPARAQTCPTARTPSSA